VFPLRDHNPTEIFPFFTVLIMVLTAGTWLLVQGLGLSDNALYESICTLGVVPADITGLNVVKGANVCESSNIGMASVLSSMFLHVSWGHLLGNLWFLWVFGNNIEDSMGHLSFVAFYLITGTAAVMAHIAVNPSSAVPMVGASGAISGIMGAYLVLYPRISIDTWVFFVVLKLPAWFMLGYWISIQLTGVLGPGSVDGGVAYGAHLGGFVAGLLLVPFFRNKKLVKAKKRGIVLPRAEIDNRGWW
tara:strand:+ start:4824 stop:5561 length:738 start_codon:yes stop_codon:yes gene_type:complete